MDEEETAQEGSLAEADETAAPLQIPCHSSSNVLQTTTTQVKAPTVDPCKILKSMAPLLCQNGGIKGEEEAATVASLMRDANKMVSKCIYVNVLKSTDGQDILEKFLINGGWDIMNEWLHDARESENTPLLMEILRVYHTLPVTIDIMKKNDAAKTIKQLRKSEDEGIKSLAGGIVDQWMKKIREKSNIENSNDKSAKKKKKHEKQEKTKTDFKEKKELDGNVEPKTSEPSMEGSVKAEQMDTEQSVMANKNINKVLLDKAPKEERKRPNTVKSYPSKFRSTGG